MARCHCRGLLAIALSRHDGRGIMSLLSHACDGILSLLSHVGNDIADDYANLTVGLISI
jgi:hypothetical protein